MSVNVSYQGMDPKYVLLEDGSLDPITDGVSQLMYHVGIAQLTPATAHEFYFRFLLAERMEGKLWIAEKPLTLEDIQERQGLKLTNVISVTRSEFIKDLLRVTSAEIGYQITQEVSKATVRLTAKGRAALLEAGADPNAPGYFTPTPDQGAESDVR